MEKDEKQMVVGKILREVAVKKEERQKMLTIKKLWDVYVEEGEIIRGRAQKIKVFVAMKDGIRYVCVREFYRKLGATEWSPGRNGITIPVQVRMHNGIDEEYPLAELLVLLQKALETVTEMDVDTKINSLFYVALNRHLGLGTFEEMQQKVAEERVRLRQEAAELKAVKNKQKDGGCSDEK